MSHRSKYLIAGSVLLGMLVTGCGSLNQLQRSVIAYSEGKFLQSEATLKTYVQGKKATKDVNYTLLLLTLADTQYRLGDYRKALTTYDAAFKNLTAELSALKTTSEYLKRDTKTLWRGKGTDRLFIHYRMGMCYFMIDDYENARIEFAQALLSDLGAEAAQKGDVVSIHYFQGLCFHRLGNTADAAVSFRKVTELLPDFPLGWYELALAEDKAGDKVAGDAAWLKYLSLAPENQRLERSDEAVCILLVADLNSARFTKKSVYQNQLKPGQRTKETQLELSLNRQNAEHATRTDDILYQYKTEGGKVESFVKDAASAIAKESLRQFVPGAGLFIGKNEADHRVWYTMPGSVYMAMLPAAPGQYTITLKFNGPANAKKKNSANAPLEALSQNWYYVTPRQHAMVKPVNILSLDQLHNLNIDHQSVAVK